MSEAAKAFNIDSFTDIDDLINQLNEVEGESGPAAHALAEVIAELRDIYGLTKAGEVTPTERATGAILSEAGASERQKISDRRILNDLDAYLGNPEYANNPEAAIEAWRANNGLKTEKDFEGLL